ncbi:MAG: hypothetical protein ACHQ2E_11200 [Gemmatimonadales bacterium]
MARFFWYLVMLALAAGLVLGASWAIAFNSVGDLLGAPPPQMGQQHTQIIWADPRRTPTQPFFWRYSFEPTVIPGATSVQIDISPLGHIINTFPSDLARRLADFHR